LQVELIRHGSTQWNLQGRLHGITDVALSREGKRDVSALGSRLASRSNKAQQYYIMSSPALRARQTAQIALGRTGIDIWPDLQEMNFGDYEGLSRSTIQELNGKHWNVLVDGCPGGEPLTDLRNRCGRLAARFKYADMPQICFTHGVLIRALTATVLNEQWTEWGMKVVPPCSITTLEYNNERWALVSFAAL
jgi:broad specificity phosphatase PhoE